MGALEYKYPKSVLVMESRFCELAPSAPKFNTDGHDNVRRLSDNAYFLGGRSRIADSRLC